MLQKIYKSRPARLALTLAVVAAANLAHAQATPPAAFTETSLSGVLAIVLAFIGVGVSIALAMTIFKVGKRAQNKV